MAFNDRIQSVVQLKKRKWTGPKECKLCGEKETADHIFFECPVAIFVWTVIKDLCGLLRVPTKCAELVELLTQSRVRNFNSLFLFLCAGALWAIWKTRNAWVFEDKLLKSPIELIYKDKGAPDELEGATACERLGEARRTS